MFCEIRFVFLLARVFPIGSNSIFMAPKKSKGKGDALSSGQVCGLTYNRHKFSQGKPSIYSL